MADEKQFGHTRRLRSRVSALGRRAAIAFAVFTAAAGAVLGLLPDLVAGNVNNEDFQLKAWAGGWLTAIGLAALVLGLAAWRNRDRLLAERGTVYVVDSPAEGWTPEEKDAFLKGAVNEFASVLHVPGPTGLTLWRWPTDERAIRWSDAVDDLVLSYRSVFKNDDSSTPNSLVSWSTFAVAIAWTARLCASERSARLAVRQRPTRGRQGEIDLPPWDQGVHAFKPAADYTPQGATRAARPLALVLTGPAVSEPTTISRVLLVRMTSGPWDAVPCDDSVGPVSLTAVNRSGLDLASSPTCDLLEWRVVPPQGSMHPWATYPALVAEICDWIEANASSEAVTLLGMQVPQEISMGIGINVASRHDGQWPANLWPLIKASASEPLVIPGLSLGFASLHQHHKDGPR